MAPRVNSPSSEPTNAAHHEPLRKPAAVATALAALPTTPTVLTTGFIARIGASLSAGPHLVPLTGSMGQALPVGIGIALATGRRTLVLDGDGSILMNPAALLTLGGLPDLPLLHVILDDGIYDSTGGQPSPGAHVDLLAVARASGLAHVHQVQTAAELTTLLHSEEGTTAPVLIRCLVTPDPAPPPPRITTPLPTIAGRFTRWIADQH